MDKRLLAALMLPLLMFDFLLIALNVAPVLASETIYIMADGSINPPTAPITTTDNVTYLFTSQINASIIVQRNNIIISGGAYALHGPENDTGIDLGNLINVTVQKTSISGFTWGIYMHNSNASRILQDDLTNNQYGIFVSQSNNNIISDNNVINSTSRGICLSSSANNTVCGNNIQTNLIGIEIQSSSSNRLYHNNFIYNSNASAYVTPSSPNVWDNGYPSCGNYWSDYSGSDAHSGPYQNQTGADGAGDTSYALDTDNVDHYPIMNQWTYSFSVFSQMIVGRTLSPLTLDPARAYDAPSIEIAMNVYEPLIFFNKEKTDQFVPRLATDWNISPDGLTYTFRIRQYVPFHNVTETLSSEDVEYSFERIFVIEHDLAWMFYEAFFDVLGSQDTPGHFIVTGQQIDNAITRNDTAVMLHLVKPYPPLMQILAQFGSILCKQWCVGIGDWPGTWNNWTLYNKPSTTAIESQNTDPPGPHTNAMCGTGPYMLDYYQTGVEWQLTKFDSYWGGWPAPGSGGHFKFVTAEISNFQTLKDKFLSWQLDQIPVPLANVSQIIGQPGVQSIYPLEQLLADAFFFTFNISTSSQYMGVPGGLPEGTLNQTGIPPDFFTDINVRKGFAYAFDYNALINVTLNGAASQPATPILPELPYYNPAQEKYSFNLTRAQQYFMAAWNGSLWSSGFTFTILYNRGSIVHKAISQILKANIESLNPKFHVQISDLTSTDYNNALVNHEAPIFSSGWLADFADPHDFALGFMNDTFGFAEMQLYSNSTLDALIEQGVHAWNETARRQTYYTLQSVYHDDCPSVPTYQPLGYRFQRDWVQGWHFIPILSSWGIDYFYDEWKGSAFESPRYSWNTFRHDITHTGCGDGPAPETNRVQWNFTTGNEVISSPAVADGKVYVGSWDSNVYCFDAYHGTVLWKVATGGSVTSSPAVADGKVYVGCDDHKLYCFDSVTGASVWNFSYGGPISSPAVTGGLVYFGTGSGDCSIRCCNASTGAEVWSFNTGEWVSSSPAVVGNSVYCLSEDGNVYCLDALTGSKTWNRTIWTNLGFTPFITSSPAVLNGLLYIGSENGTVYCLNAYNGSVVWTYTTGDSVESSPAVAYGKVYIGSWDGALYCLNATTGERLWALNATSGIFSSPTVADGKVYVGTWNCILYCLNASTGSEVWNYTTGEQIMATPAVANGLVLVGSSDYKMYAFGNVIRVPEDYPTVQAAINAAASGATIWIAPGIYHESLIINKTINLIGEVGSEPTFDGGGTGIAMKIVTSGSGSTIAGIMITKWDQGILIQDASGCKIYDDIMSLINKNGICLEGANSLNNQIYSNVFENDVVAIEVTASSYSTVISQNVISMGNTGLKLETSGNIVCENILSENQLGIVLMNSNNNKIYHNNFVSNYQYHVTVSASTGNVWDDGYSSGGNYWSSHDNTDVCAGPLQSIQGVSDGIADKKYTVATNNVDNYPLAQAFAIHNIGITLVQPRNIVGQPSTLRISFNIVNFGMFSETFIFIYLLDTTPVCNQQVTLDSRASQTFDFTIDSAGMTKGRHTLTASAGPVLYESNAADNTVASWFNVTISGDVDGNFRVDMGDITALCDAFGSTQGTLGFYWHHPSCVVCPHSSNCDIDGNRRVDMGDINYALDNFGKSVHYP